MSAAQSVQSISHFVKADAYAGCVLWWPTDFLSPSLRNAAGTLLDSQSKVLPSSVSAIKAALDQGVLVCLATGKARPAAISALQSVGLAGKAAVLDCLLHDDLHWT